MSLFARWGWTSILVLALATGLQGDEPQPGGRLGDLLPASEIASFSFRDVGVLKREGEALIDAVGIPMSFRPSQTVEFGVSWLGLKEEFDERAAVSLIITDTDKKPDIGRGWVLAVPFQSRSAVAERVGLDPDSSEPAAVPKLTNDVGFVGQGALGQRHLLLTFGPVDADSGNSLTTVLHGPRLVDHLSPESNHWLNSTDMVLHGGIARLNAVDPIRTDLKFVLPDAPLDVDEQEAAESLRTAFDELEHAFLGLSVGDGLLAQTRLQFAAAADSASRRLLDDLRGEGPQRAPAPSLAGLPKGPVLIAGTARLTQPRQQLLLRTFTKIMAAHANTPSWGLSSSWGIGAVTDLRQSVVLGALGEVLPLADEVRFGIYPSGAGHYTTIVMLDSDHPDQIIARIRELSDQLIAPTQAGTDGKPPQLTEQQVQTLIQQLTAEDLATRNRAATRLMLQGPKNLKWLDNAAQSDDPETARRVQLLLNKMESSSQQRAERLLTDNPLVSAHPQLTYHPAAETSAGRSVDVIEIALPEAETAQSEPLSEMFGAGWNRVRVVRLDRHVVLAFGAPDPWLPAALDNLQNGRPGLAYHSRLVNLADDPQRLLELHLPVSRIVPEAEHRYFAAGEPKDKRPSVGLTAIGLSASDRELWLDVHFPVDELRGLVVKRGWSW